MSVIQRWRESGFMNPKQFAQKFAKELNKTQKEIIQTISDSRETVKKRKINKSEMSSIVAPHPGFVQMDLVDLSRYVTKNKGHIFLFIAIDVYSRYGFAYPLKSKKTKDVLEAVLKMKKEIPSLTAVTHDSGKEYEGEVREFLEKNNIKIYKTEPGDHNRLGVIDRFIRTIREKLANLFAINESTKWIDDIKNIIDNYNQTEHRTLESTPEDVLLGNEPGISEQKNTQDIHEYKDKEVRILSEKKLGSKSSDQKYSSETFKVVKRSGNKLTLDNGKSYPIYKLKISNSKAKGYSEEDDQLRRDKLYKLRMMKEDIN